MLMLLDAQGGQHPLLLNDNLAADFGGVDALLGHTVTLEVALQQNAAQQLAAAPVVAIKEVLPLGALESNLVVGNERWLMLLCRPPEYTQTVPNAQTHYTRLLGDEAPGMGDYWRELSYGQYSTAESAVAGWFTLPRPWQQYIAPMAGAYALDAAPVKADCTAAADPVVYFPDYDGIVFVVPVAPIGMDNGMPNWYAWAWYGKTDRLELDGVSRAYRTTYFPIEIGAWASNIPCVWSHSILPHEIGHTLGLPHSSGPYGATYDSGWDVMSGSQWQGRSYHCLRDDEFGCLAPQTIAFHKAKLGWVTSDETVVVEAGSSQMLILARPTAPITQSVQTVPLPPEDLITPPQSTTRYLKIPMLGSTTQFYTAEARGGLLYDQSAPADAVVLHAVDTTRGASPAHVVDPDENGDPNDAAAAWLPGETFNDPLHEINFCVEAATAAGYLVGVGNGAPAPCTLLPHFESSAMELSPISASPGATMTNVLMVQNDGSLARNVAVTMTLPAELTLITTTIKATGGEVESLTPLVFTMGNMAYGASAQLSFEVLVDATLTGTVTPVVETILIWDGGEMPLTETPPVPDTTPPETNITIVGDVNSMDEYLGPANVVLAATDADSGVLSTHYSLDKGATWRVYRSMLSIAAGTSTTIQAYSIDKAGNEETPPKEAALRFNLLTEFAYLPAVQK
jgi:M6 family metalloprotease-like protein